jgi:SAM-dependent methyltransferase
MKTKIAGDTSLDLAFDVVKKQFPFQGYVNLYCYYQMLAIVGALRQFIPDFKGKSLLDVGSGPMDKTAVFQRLGFSCSAVDDLSDPWHRLPGNVEKIVDFSQRMGIDFYLQNSENYSIPFPINSFDVVTSIAVIEHLHDSPRHILNAMGEHLRDEGLLIIVMPNAVNLRKRISVFFGKSNYNPVDEMLFSIGEYRGHVREYTLAETRYICEQTGFEVLLAKTFEHIAPSRLSSGICEIYLAICTLLPTLRSGLLVVARKPKGWIPLAEDRNRYFDSIAQALPNAATKLDAGSKHAT